MTELLREQIVDKLKDCVTRETGITGITEETQLLENGILDSLLIVTIISYCESEFACTFAPDEIEEEHFEKIGALADQVCRHRQKQSKLNN